MRQRREKKNMKNDGNIEKKISSVVSKGIQKKKTPDLHSVNIDLTPGAGSVGDDDFRKSKTVQRPIHCGHSD